MKKKNSDYHPDRQIRDLEEPPVLFNVKLIFRESRGSMILNKLDIDFKEPNLTLNFK